MSASESSSDSYEFVSINPVKGKNGSAIAHSLMAEDLGSIAIK